jgi:hypothetical protein
MLESQAVVLTELPARYMGQLCKHFAHKLPVVLEERSGSIDFPIGLCTLRADTGALVMRLASATAEDLARLQDVVARHLLRFAFREPPEIVWAAVAG